MLKDLAPARMLFLSAALVALLAVNAAMPKRRIETYIPLVQEFSSRLVFFHAAIASRLGLHLTDLKALHLLGRKPMTAGTLAEQVGLTLPAVTALIDRLEKASYVVRERASKDRRKVTVRVIPESLGKVNKLYDGQYVRMSNLFAKYSAEQFTAIMDFLDKQIRSSWRKRLSCGKTVERAQNRR